MATPAARAEELKMLLRGLLISSPHTLTAEQLERDFLRQEGHGVPFRELGYPSFMKYLESIPETVVIRPSSTGPVVVPVTSEKSAHIKKMVLKQKAHPPKRSSTTRLPAYSRSSVNTTQMSSAYHGANYISNSSHQPIFLPASLQQRICKMINDNPQGVLVQTIEQEFLSGKVLHNYGIPDGCDISYLLSHLSHILRISDGVVYPLHSQTPPHGTLTQNQVTDDKTSNSRTNMFIPAGCEGEIDVCNHSCTENVVNEFSGERNKDAFADVAGAWYKQAKVTEVVENSFVSTTRSLTFDTEEALKVSLDSGSQSDDTDFVSDLVSKKMRMNFQTLLDKQPNGIWCSELPDLYKKEFAVVLEYANLGFLSVMQMASSLPDVFHCIKVGETDCKLFDARKKLPPEYAKYDMKRNVTVSTKMVPKVPTKIGLNIKKLLTFYSAGIPSEQIPQLYEHLVSSHSVSVRITHLLRADSSLLSTSALYGCLQRVTIPDAVIIQLDLLRMSMEEFLTTLNVHDLGFCSLEAFLLVLKQSHLLHMRYVKTKILVFPAPQETETESEPETAVALPHITEPQDHFQSLYPPEVIGPKGTLAYEKIPPEARPGAYIEVLVAEVITPLNFWVLLRGKKTHVALDILMNDMQQFYLKEAGNYNMPDATVRIGQYCVAPYNKEWHRACITAVHNLVHVQVMFVDYGTSCKIRKSDLRFMHTDFAQFPIQAIRASLANLVPVGGGTKWPREAGVCFLELVASKDLIAIVCTVDHEARKMDIALVDTTTEEDIHINDVLVKKGLADYKTKRRTSPLPPQSQRIDEDPMSSTITVSRPPPGFTAVSELYKQPFTSTTGSVAPGQKYVPAMPGRPHPHTLLPNVPTANTILQKSSFVPETQGQSHLLISLPNLPIANTMQSNFLPQPANLAVPPVMYDAPSLAAHASSLAAQSSVFQRILLYENFVKQEQLKTYYALLLSQNIGAASLVNPFFVPELNPVVYIPTPGYERVTNVGQSELGISEVPSCTLPSQKNDLGQISPSGTADAHVSAEDPASALATFHIHTDTKEPASVLSSGVSHLPVLNSSTDLCTTDAADLSSGSDDVYRSDDGYDDDDDDDDEEEEGEGLCQYQEQPTLRKSSYVQQVEIAGRLIHVIKIENALFFCTEEVVRHFTDFSGRHVVLKILDARDVKVPFYEIGRTCSRAIIDDLETYNIMGVPKSREGHIIGKVHLTPLNAFTHLIPFLTEEYKQEFCSVMATLQWLPLILTGLSNKSGVTGMSGSSPDMDWQLRFKP